METDAAPLPRVFLAEDNPADVYLIEQALKINGITCDLAVAEDGRQALSFFRNEGNLSDSARPRLILLDLNLPRHDGTEILLYVRQNKQLASVPVVIFTSSDSPKDRFTAMQAGATRFFRKPSNLQDFMAIGATLRELLHGKTVAEGTS